jgi:hypothetical protein
MIYAWLVEEFGPEGNGTGRYMLDQGALTITADVYAARRLRRQMSAGFRALDMKERHGGDWRPVEHGFDDSKTPNDRIQPPRSGRLE